MDIQIVLLLANADPAKQVKTLRKMAAIFDGVDPLFTIIEAGSPAYIVHIMKENYQEG